MYVFATIGSFFTGLDPAWIALIATLCGGLGLKITEHWLGKNKVKVDDAARIRDELRLEITRLREDKKAAEEEVDEWREKYYDILGELSDARAFILSKGLALPTPPPKI